METTINEIQKAIDEQKPEVKEIPPMREIIIQTDGRDIKITKNELTNLEMMSIFSILLQKLNTK